MFDRVAPGTLKLWLILAAILYLLLPYDLVPDFFGLPGRLDDLLLMAWFAWIYHDRVRPSAGRPAGSGGTTGAPGSSSRKAGGGNAGEAPPRSDVGEGFDPYRELGVPRSASQEAIRSAYRERMRAYHPDKVAHLGEELQKLAHEKSQAIQRAYRALRR